MSNAAPIVFRGPVADFLQSDSEQIDLEGAIRSGKTTAALWKVFALCLAHPGIHCLICRYSDDDTRTKLRPVWEQVCLTAGVPLHWVADQRRFALPNDSWVYCFGLKAQDLTLRYAKFRGVTLATVYVDQAEELPFDIKEELVGRLSQRGFPQQLILTPNPPNEDSWLARDFPEDNHHTHRRYFRVSLYDNAHNLDRATVARLERAYPPHHAKHRPMLLGQRGLNVIGQPVYGPVSPYEPESAAFQRTRHVRPLTLDKNLPLYEGFDYGKHHPCVVWAQYTPWAELRLLGGLLGQDLYLEDFIPLVQHYRRLWFAEALEVLACCDPAGSHDNAQGVRQNGVSLLQDHGIYPSFRLDSNTPDVRLGVIERIAATMRRRSARGEAFAVDDTHWLRVSATAVVPHAFVIDAFEAGYVWDTHMISVSGKPMRRPKKDGWYEHGMNTVEYLEHNFGGVQPSEAERVRHAAAVRGREAPTKVIVDEYELWRRANPARRSGVGGRGGYR